MNEQPPKIDLLPVGASLVNNFSDEAMKSKVETLSAENKVILDHALDSAGTRLDIFLNVLQSSMASTEHRTEFSSLMVDLRMAQNKEAKEAAAKKIAELSQSISK